MATKVIHEHDHPVREGDGSGLVIGIILLIALLLFAWYAFSSGALSGFFPANNFPDQVDVNINQGQGQ